MNKNTQDLVLNLQDEIKQLKKKLDRTIQQVAELREMTNLAPYVAKSIKISVTKSFMTCNGLSIIRSEAERKALLSTCSKLFRLIVATRYTPQQLFFFKASNPPDDLKFLVELTVTIWNEENSKSTRKISCAGFQELYDDLKSLFQKICNSSR